MIRHIDAGYVACIIYYSYCQLHVYWEKNNLMAIQVSNGSDVSLCNDGGSYLHDGWELLRPKPNKVPRLNDDGKLS
jgi:hypothetical protein